MDSEEDFNRYRYRTRVQAVAVIDILVGTIPFITLAFAFNDKHLAEIYQDREYLVLLWSVLLCVYVLQLIMGIWLLAATREVSDYSHFVYSEYTVGNCQVWFVMEMMITGDYGDSIDPRDLYDSTQVNDLDQNINSVQIINFTKRVSQKFHVALFTFVFYTGEMAFAISSIINSPSQNIKSVMFTMSYHAAKIIYRAFTLMIVNNFLYDVCRPVYRYLSQGSYQYKYYYQTGLGIRLPTRSTSITAVPTATAIPAHPRNPIYNYYSTYPQPLNKIANANLLNPYTSQNCTSNFVHRNPIPVQ